MKSKKSLSDLSFLFTLKDNYIWPLTFSYISKIYPSYPHVSPLITLIPPYKSPLKKRKIQCHWKPLRLGGWLEIALWIFKIKNHQASSKWIRGEGWWPVPDMLRCESPPRSVRTAVSDFSQLWLTFVGVFLFQWRMGSGDYHLQVPFKICVQLVICRPLWTSGPLCLAPAVLSSSFLSSVWAQFNALPQKQFDDWVIRFPSRSNIQKPFRKTALSKVLLRVICGLVEYF